MDGMTPPIGLSFGPNAVCYGGFSMKTVLGSALMAAAAMAPAAANAEVTQTPIAGTRLDVTARGDVRRVPDIAVISAGVTTNAADAASAMQEIGRAHV